MERHHPRRIASALAFVLVLAVAYVEKQRIQAWTPVATPHQPIAWLTITLGCGAAIGWLAGAFFVLGLSLRRRPWIDTGLALGIGGAACFVLTKLGQFVLAEDRPRDGGAMHLFRHGGHGVSGHASATALLFFPLLAILCASWRPSARVAMLVALTLWIELVDVMRMALGMHHAWNVLLGTALGLWTGRLAVTLVQRLRHAPTLAMR